MKNEFTRACTEAIRHLTRLDFNLHLLASEKYNKEKLRRLNKDQMEECKAILAKVKNHRLRRTFANKPYINNKTFKSAIENANLPKLAKALHVLSVLLQRKVYLFWTRSEQ
jgi:hypothetical protein